MDQKPETRYVITVLRAAVETYLNPMIVSVRNDVLSDAIHGNTCKAVEFSFSITVLAKFFKELSVRVEHLDAVVGRIRHNNRVVGPNGYASGPSKLSGLAPPTSYLKQLMALLQVPTPRGRTYRRCCDTCKRIKTLELHSKGVRECFKGCLMLVQGAWLSTL